MSLMKTFFFYKLTYDQILAVLDTIFVPLRLKQYNCTILYLNQGQHGKTSPSNNPNPTFSSASGLHIQVKTNVKLKIKKRNQNPNHACAFQ